MVQHILRSTALKGCRPGTQEAQCALDAIEVCAACHCAACHCAAACGGGAILIANVVHANVLLRPSCSG